MEKKCRRSASSRNLDRKLFSFITCMLFGLSIIIFAIFTSVYVSSFIKQSSDIARNQLSVLANSYESAFRNYKELAIAIMIDDSVQNYIKYDGAKNEEYFALVNDARSTLQNFLNLNNQKSFIALISNNSSDYIYKGNAKIAANFIKTYLGDYENSDYGCDPGTIRMSFNNSYMGNKLTLNVYHPVYSGTNINREIGLICMVLNSSIVEELTDDGITEFDSNIFLLNQTDEGLFLMDGKQTAFEYADMLTSESGDFHIRDDLYIYQKIGNWNYYLVSKIPLLNMYKNNILVLIVLSFIIITITYFGLIISRKMVKRNYQPLEYIIHNMKHVAEGQLDVRIDMKNMGDDYKKLASGFNYMMQEINALMEQVKLEQQQMNQLRFNALQSQIHPHFLYNTLDCIHWQAMAEGHKEISVLVKALAQYYRLSLSNGKDVIPLEQEIEHVKNYLIIQNMRYDNIIECMFDIDENCNNILIPKITLQPLIENSIYHGVKVKEGKKGVINITGRRVETDVYIMVEDNGTGMTDEQIVEMNQSIRQYDKDFGYGIRNVNKRIEILFGKEYGLYYEKNSSGGVTVTIHLPSHVVPEYEEVL